MEQDVYGLRELANVKIVAVYKYISLHSNASLTSFEQQYDSIMTFVLMGGLKRSNSSQIIWSNIKSLDDVPQLYDDLWNALEKLITPNTIQKYKEELVDMKKLLKQCIPDVGMLRTTLDTYFSSIEHNNKMGDSIPLRKKFFRSETCLNSMSTVWDKLQHVLLCSKNVESDVADFIAKEPIVSSHQQFQQVLQKVHFENGKFKNPLSCNSFETLLGYVTKQCIPSEIRWNHFQILKQKLETTSVPEVRLEWYFQCMFNELKYNTYFSASIILQLVFNDLPVLNAISQEGNRLFEKYCKMCAKMIRWAPNPSIAEYWFTKHEEQNFPWTSHIITCFLYVIFMNQTEEESVQERQRIEKLIKLAEKNGFDDGDVFKNVLRLRDMELSDTSDTMSVSSLSFPTIHSAEYSQAAIVTMQDRNITKQQVEHCLLYGTRDKESSIQDKSIFKVTDSSIIVFYQFIKKAINNKSKSATVVTKIEVTAAYKYSDLHTIESATTFEQQYDSILTFVLMGGLNSKNSLQISWSHVKSLNDVPNLYDVLWKALEQLITPNAIRNNKGALVELKRLLEDFVPDVGMLKTTLAKYFAAV